MKNPFDISRMTGSAYEQKLKDAPAVLLPLASQEILGSHGPLGADMIVSNHVTPLIAQQTQCLYAPCIPYGDTLELEGWAGTVHVESRLLEAYCEAVARAFLERDKAAALVFIAYHSLNLKAVDALCRRLKLEGHTVFAVDWWRAASQCGKKLLKDQQSGTGHGAELTTSVLMALENGLIAQPLPAGEQPLDGLSRTLAYQFGAGHAYQAYGCFREYCTTGAWGDLSGATKDKGALIIQETVDLIAETIQSFLSHT
mgnify:FL=1